ncbi:hypothetical protein F443_16187 [Phytophthora nicotianae P1569]|uniref:Uncharacterized protein n=1 Tax=Phytophthora nicotianae P1569 TaxID=1317065 RepID=V9EHG5_PHYNI|nr:hypothetical protein F443_16187 [Phytophthora nicotianae P1569]
MKAVGFNQVNTGGRRWCVEKLHESNVRREGRKFSRLGTGEDTRE